MKPTTKTATREQLVSTAKQLNRILAVNTADAIKFGPKVKDEDLKKGIVLLGEEIEATDFEVNPDNPDFIPFDADAVYTFEVLGVLIPKKPAPVKKDEKGKKAPKAAAKKEVKTPRANRTTSFCNCLDKKGKLITTLAQETDNAFVAAGGNSNIGQTIHMIKVYLPVLIGLGIVSNDDGIIKLIK